MEAEREKNRYRINIKETAKKEKYWDCTVEIVDGSIESVLKASDELVAELDKRYPAQGV